MKCQTINTFLLVLHLGSHISPKSRKEFTWLAFNLCNKGTNLASRAVSLVYHYHFLQVHISKLERAHKINNDEANMTAGK